MAEDPYVTGPKSRAERKAAQDDDPKGRRKSHRKWYEILTDTMVPGKFQHGMISESARKVREATKK